MTIHGIYMATIEKEKGAGRLICVAVPLCGHHVMMLGSKRVLPP